MAIVLQETLRAVFYAPFYAALALGAYKDEGLDVQLVTAPKPSAAARSLAEGRADVAWGGPMRVLHTYDMDPDCDLVCFCEVATRDPFFLVGRTAKADFRLADLLSVRLATVSEVPTPWLCLQEDMRRAGLDPARLERIGDRSMAQNSDALRRGEVDVVRLLEPFVEELMARRPGYMRPAKDTSGRPPRTAVPPPTPPSMPPARSSRRGGRTAKRWCERSIARSNGYMRPTAANWLQPLPTISRCCPGPAWPRRSIATAG